MRDDDLQPITDLLQQWDGGDVGAFEDLIPLVTAELRRLAKSYLDRERAGVTLQPTALVHELYVRLLGHAPRHFRDRARFFGFAATTMRHVLVDRARARRTAKRGHDAVPLPLVAAASVAAEPEVDVIALHEALETLAALDARQSRIVELRAFAGLSLQQTADLLEVSEATVSRDWAAARAWLLRHLTERS